ncbi:hypothetical protein [Prevotella sp. HUN102]|uniref:hypothetical protein n=1 Tax=Prevotella sp. HUN102 TaxID=1392486 RepID=UPI00048A864D|nr:hypothetical protein [Prevotella sp. HUN102]
MKEQDFSLDELFADYKPDLGSNEAYMAALNKRLDDIELVRKYSEARIQRYRMAVLVAFVVGLVFGCIGFFLILTMPTNVPLFTFNINLPLFTLLNENSRFVTLTAISLFMGIATLKTVGWFMVRTQEIKIQKTMNGSGEKVD